MKFRKREGECDDNTFWECVAEIGWPKCESSKVSKDLLFAWTPEFAESFRKRLDRRQGEISRAFEKYEEDGFEERDYWLGDDSFGDLMGHMVGLGKEAYEAALADLSLVVERARSGDYKESFSYCIPYPPSVTSDFEKYMDIMGYPTTKEGWEDRASRYGYDDLETYDEWIKHMKEDHLCALKGDWRYIDPDHYAVVSGPYHRRCKLFLEALGEQGSLTDAEQKAYDAIDRLVSYFQLLEKKQTDDALAASEIALQSWWLAYAIAEQGELRDKHVRLMPMYGNKLYGGENIINDHRRYLGDLDAFKCRHHYNKLKKAA